MLLRNQLEEIAEDYPGLMRMVAIDALEYDDEEISGYLTELVNKGASVVKPHHLIHNRECARIFDEFYAEIEDYRRIHKQETGDDPRLGDDLKKSLAWFGYEAAARKIAGLVRLKPRFSE